MQSACAWIGAVRAQHRNTPSNAAMLTPAPVRSVSSPAQIRPIFA